MAYSPGTRVVSDAGTSRRRGAGGVKEGEILVWYSYTRGILFSAQKREKGLINEQDSESIYGTGKDFYRRGKNGFSYIPPRRGIIFFSDLRGGLKAGKAPPLFVRPPPPIY